MTHGPEHHIEHAEHSAHAGHDPFERRVIMTVAIIAALLAAVTLLSHRAHNATLQFQLEATDAMTEASNQWNYFQSKKNRQYLYETADRQTMALLTQPIPGVPRTSDQFKAWKKEIDELAKPWRKDVARYKEQTAKIEEKANEYMEEARKHRAESKHMHHLGDRYDMAELGVEVGLVLCSLAVLTRRRGFWYSGMACALAGVVVSLWGVVEQYGAVAHH